MEHDNSYKLLFAHADLVADLLRGFVHEPWVAELDFGTLERFSSSHVSDSLQDRHDDLIWRVRWRGRDWLYIYLLLEFQATQRSLYGSAAAGLSHAAVSGTDPQ